VVRNDLGMVTGHLRAEPMRAQLSGASIEELMRRLRAVRMPSDAGDTWERGTPGRWLAELVADWLEFDLVALQDRLDELVHLRVDIDGISVHLAHVPGNGPDPLPIVLTHGWPSSFLEYLKLIPLLTDPAAHGAAGTDSFSVVAPSLPGFGFSGPPPAAGLTHEQVARSWWRIMVEALGYERFVAHGSDLGAGVTARLARAHPEAVAAIHLATPGLPAPPQPWTDAVREHVHEVEAWTREEGGYAHMHSTKPSTLAAALDDSPVGLAAWIGEKLTAWSSVTPEGRSACDREHMLATLTLYWTTRTAGSSLLPYWAYSHTPASALRVDDPVSTPTAIDIFGGEIVPFPKPPRELAERYFNVVHWAEHDSGGHFPAVATPQVLADRLREVFRPCRRRGAGGADGG
jgi:pimeloyl-ACP methyl ester carboxylesterase